MTLGRYRLGSVAVAFHTPVRAARAYAQMCADASSFVVKFLPFLFAAHGEVLWVLIGLWILNKSSGL